MGDGAESSISLPNSAPSRNSGKNWATNRRAAHECRVQLASSGSPEKARDQAGDRRENEDARAAECKKDQARKADENAQESRG